MLSLDLELEKAFDRQTAHEVRGSVRWRSIGTRRLFGGVSVVDDFKVRGRVEGRTTDNCSCCWLQSEGYRARKQFRRQMSPVPERRRRVVRGSI